MQVYFDNAATTPLRPEVIEVMHGVLKETYGNPLPRTVLDVLHVHK